MSISLYQPLRQFVNDLACLLDRTREEEQILAQGTTLLQTLIARDDWLDAEFTRPDPERYQQYLLHADAQQRFSVVSFVWGPGQTTPVHDHRVWGLIGVLRGAEISQNYRQNSDGLHLHGAPVRLEAGSVEAVSPQVGDIHKVSNAFADRTSISIHVYGGNIGGIKRAVYRPDGEQKPFISGYDNHHLPNIWDFSK
ncbi:cysteine dioxygenase [Izhakiella australiensis]|uniref:Cysteine dioxygenase n=1 Tax=Izhakiella australiensis TaxID=1926881 RepID=A0A1S8YG79_9GAMM|nr:cysteine dioxygenase [Izhakiella australiensis]OON38081.1 cysteine dioxygenase [Izhakiella australiensis]